MPTPSRLTEPIAEMDFFDALRRVAHGERIRRLGWGNRDCVFLYAERLHLRVMDGTLHQLLVSQGDMTATDWVVANEADA